MFAIVVNRNLVTRSACTLASSRLVNQALRVRKEHAGCLLKATREIKCLSIKGEKDFGDTIHTTFMTQPINKYKGTLPYLLMNVGGALLQMGLAHWYMFTN